MKRIYTIGHSTLTLDNFISMLCGHCIEIVADVRRFPASRRNPHFNKDELATELTKLDLKYAWLPDLGGRRSTSVLSTENDGWRVDAFHAFADHMKTSEFQDSLQRLKQMALNDNTAIMCAEAQWVRCHRRLISDALMAQGWTVIHILSRTRTEAHTLTKFARVEKGLVTYPAESDAKAQMQLPY